MAALCLGALIDKPSHAGRSCRILGRPEQLHLNAFSAAHFVQMLLFANTRALCGPQRAEQTGQGPSREHSAADLLLIASTEAEAIMPLLLPLPPRTTLREMRVWDGVLSPSHQPPLDFGGSLPHLSHLFCFVQSTCLYFRLTDLLVPNPSI